MAIIKITENQLKYIIRESIFNTGIYYRGCSKGEAKKLYEPKVLWITEDDFYAKEYYNENPQENVIIEYVIDESKLKYVSLYKIDNILGYEFDAYNMTDEEADEILHNGYNCYTLDFDSYNASGLCLLDKSCILSQRILSDEEIHNIES